MSSPQTGELFAVQCRPPAPQSRLSMLEQRRQARISVARIAAPVARHGPRAVDRAEEIIYFWRLSSAGSSSIASATVRSAERSEEARARATPDRSCSLRFWLSFCFAPTLETVISTPTMALSMRLM